MKGDHRVQSGLSTGDFLWSQASAPRKLPQGGLPPQFGTQRRPGVSHQCALLLEGAADLHRAVIPEKAADLPGNLGYGVSGKLGAEVRVIALHRLEKP